MLLLSHLPDELLQLIFAWCLPSQDFAPYLIARPLSTTAPLLLTQICVRWRNVAVATPELWTFMRTIFRPISAESVTVPVDPLLTLWLQRAAPLSITLVIADIAVGSLYDVLRRFPTRLAHLHVHGLQLTELCRTALADSMLALPSLQTLLLRPTYAQDILLLDNLITPQLRNLTSRRRQPGLRLERLASLIARSACGAELTHMSLSTHGASPDLLALLRATPNVHHLELHDEQHYALLPAFQHLLERDILPSLQNLRLESIAGYGHTRFDAQTLVRILQQRHRRNPSLKTAYLNLEGPDRHAFYPWDSDEEEQEARATLDTRAYASELHKLMLDGLDLHVRKQSGHRRWADSDSSNDETDEESEYE
ncbi:F-box domain-containing protein [Mycena kentingensis (nom. inval.)]|nr:F-box domain-containing protein [Mycena kentingensis (nom. inval.)]